MRWKLVVGAGLGTALAAGLAVRVAHSRHRRSLHPKGRSFAGEVELWGLSDYGPDADLLHRAARYRATVRFSKGGGTPRGWADLLGFAVRVHAPDGERDLLWSTAGTGRLTRHLPTPRRSFHTDYGSIMAYRTDRREDGHLYLWAAPEPGTPDRDGLPERMLLSVEDDRGRRPFGRVCLGTALPDEEDAALAFDPVRHTTPGLHPTGLVHGSRRYAYPLSQRWRGVSGRRR